MNLPNINRIDIRLRRFFEPNVSACTHHVNKHKSCDKQQKHEGGNRNQSFYPKFHIEGTGNSNIFCRNYLTERTRNTTASLSNLLNTHILRPANFCLPIISKISNRNHQPDNHGKPYGRDSELKEGFYKFHKAAGKAVEWSFRLFQKQRFKKV